MRDIRSRDRVSCNGSMIRATIRRNSMIAQFNIGTNSTDNGALMPDIVSRSAGANSTQSYQSSGTWWVWENDRVTELTPRESDQLEWVISS